MVFKDGLYKCDGLDVFLPPCQQIMERWTVHCRCWNMLERVVTPSLICMSHTTTSAMTLWSAWNPQPCTCQPRCCTCLVAGVYGRVHTDECWIPRNSFFSPTLPRTKRCHSSRGHPKVPPPPEFLDPSAPSGYLDLQNGCKGNMGTSSSLVKVC